MGDLSDGGGAKAGVLQTASSVFDFMTPFLVVVERRMAMIFMPIQRRDRQAI